MTRPLPPLWGPLGPSGNLGNFREVRIVGCERLRQWKRKKDERPVATAYAAFLRHFPLWRSNCSFRITPPNYSSSCFNISQYEIFDIFISLKFIDLTISSEFLDMSWPPGPKELELEKKRKREDLSQSRIIITDNVYEDALENGLMFLRMRRRISSLLRIVDNYP